MWGGGWGAHCGEHAQWLSQELALIHEQFSLCLLPPDLLPALSCSGGHENSQPLCPSWRKGWGLGAQGLSSGGRSQLQQRAFCEAESCHSLWARGGGGWAVAHSRALPGPITLDQRFLTLYRSQHGPHYGFETLKDSNSAQSRQNGQRL